LIIFSRKNGFLIEKNSEKIQGKKNILLEKQFLREKGFFGVKKDFLVKKDFQRICF
jgi:hypothetical protein